MLGNHLLGLYEKALPPEWDWNARLSAAKELGFDFVELSIDETDRRLARLDWGRAERRALHQALEDSGMYFQSMCLSAHRRFPFGSAGPAVRERAGEIMEKALLFAREFGIRVIQLAGYDVYYEPSTPESRERFLQGLERACRLAEKYHVMLAVEIMDTPLLSSISRYMAFKERLPSPWFLVYPDIGNLTAWGNDVPAELLLGGRQMVSIHLKDTLAVTADFPGKFKCVPFGAGCVDFAAALGQLEALGYRGPYMLEMWYQQGQDPKSSVADARAFLEGQYRKACIPSA